MTIAFLDPERFARSALGDLERFGVDATVASREGRPALHLVEAAPSGEPIAILPDSEMGDGIIEATLSGAPLPDAAPEMRGFVGIAFHVRDPRTFELFFLRPTNGRADDQLRRNHALQYCAYPDHPWHRLRADAPGRYESYADLEPDVLTDIRITISGTRARLYVHGAAQPALVVNDLKLGPVRGRTAIWIGAGTDASVSRLRITPAIGGAVE